MIEEGGWLSSPSTGAIPGCTLQAHGLHFRPQEFLRLCTFPEESLLFYGGLRVPPGLTMSATGRDAEVADAIRYFEGPFLLLSLSQSVVFQIQVSEAMEFIQKYKNHLLALRDRPDVESRIIQFLPGPDEIRTHDDLPRDFLRLVSSVGIEAVLFRDATPHR